MSIQNEHPPLTIVKYKIIAPYLTDEKTLTFITEGTGIAKKNATILDSGL